MRLASLVVTAALAVAWLAPGAFAAGNCTDGVLNNNETQVDCGGPNCALCPEPSPLPTPSPSPSPAVAPTGKASSVFSNAGLLSGIGIGSVVISIVFHAVLVMQTRVRESHAVSLTTKTKHSRTTGSSSSKRKKSKKKKSSRKNRSGSPRSAFGTTTVSVTPTHGGSTPSNLRVEEE